MTKLSIVLGVLGLVATAVVMPYASRWVSNWGPRQHWLLGTHCALSRLAHCLSGSASSIPSGRIEIPLTSLGASLFSYRALRSYLDGDGGETA